MLFKLQFCRQDITNKDPKQPIQYFKKLSKKHSRQQNITMLKSFIFMIFVLKDFMLLKADYSDPQIQKRCRNTYTTYQSN